MAQGLDEGLDQHRWCCSTRPTHWAGAGRPGRGCAIRVWGSRPRQDQEPVVVNDQGHVLPARYGDPTDEVVPWDEFPSGGAEAEAGNGIAVLVMADVTPEL